MQLPCSVRQPGPVPHFQRRSRPMAGQLANGLRQGLPDFLASALLSVPRSTALLTTGAQLVNRQRFSDCTFLVLAVLPISHHARPAQPTPWPTPRPPPDSDQCGPLHFKRAFSYCPTTYELVSTLPVAHCIPTHGFQCGKDPEGFRTHAAPATRTYPPQHEITACRAAVRPGPPYIPTTKRTHPHTISSQ